jgi:2-methylcitrate dehydratase PrpD
MDQSLLERLAQHLQRPIPQDVRTRARLHLLDWLACVAGARGSEVANVVRSMSLGELDRAAYLGNFLEMDDVHRAALLHAGPVIWPSAFLPLADQDCDAGLDEIVVAAIQGYEAMIVIGATMDAHHYAHWHPTATVGAFGAAAATASMLQLDQAQMTDALGNAGSLAGGLWQMRHEVALTKQLHVASVTRHGFFASYGAMHGLTGPRFILEGPQGLYAAMCRDPKPMVFTDHWRIEEVSLKPWAACRHAHPVIDCALELRAAGRLEAPFVAETYRDAITFCDKPDPMTELDAKFSLQHAIADGRGATPADFTPEAIAALAPLRAQVSVREAPEITARYPAHFGARLNGFELIDTRGDPERPVTEADIIAKMHMLAEWGGLPPDEADRAVELALRGDDAGAISKMLEDWLS